MTADADKPRRLPRFSLRSLILFVTLAGSGYGLWARWEPWAEVYQVRVPRLEPKRVRFMGNGTRLLITGESPPMDNVARYLIAGESPLDPVVGTGVKGVLVIPTESKSIEYNLDARQFDMNLRDAERASHLSPPEPRRIYGDHEIRLIDILPTISSNPRFYHKVEIVSIPEGAVLATVELEGVPAMEITPIYDAALSDTGDVLAVIGMDGSLRIYRRNHPEYWWGVAWLPEFWLTVVLGVGLTVSVWRDQRTLKKTA